LCTEHLPQPVQCSFYLLLHHNILSL